MTKRKPTPVTPARRAGVVEVHHHYHGTTPAEPKAKPVPVRRKPTRRG